MKLDEKERRRLDALAFRILEREDGFRLQTLVELRHRAGREGRLLIEMLRRQRKISSNRQIEIAAAIGADISETNSSMFDETLGEESFEDSLVDVAPTHNYGPASHSPLAARGTVTQGSMGAQKILDEHGERKTNLTDEAHPSNSSNDHSMLTFNAPDERGGALLGAPSTRANAPSFEPSQHYHPTANFRGDRERLQERLFDRIDSLLSESDHSNHHRLRLATVANLYIRAQQYALEAPGQVKTARRMKAIHRRIDHFLGEQLDAWGHALMSTSNFVFDPEVDDRSPSKFIGNIEITGGVPSGELSLSRLVLQDDTVRERTVHFETEENDSIDTLQTSKMRLHSGWYGVKYSSGKRVASWQLYVEAAQTIELNLPDFSEIADGLTFVADGPAILGEPNSEQRALPHDIYSTSKFLITIEPVSLDEYLTFLGFVLKTQGPAAAKRRRPRTAARGSYLWAEYQLSDLHGLRARLGEMLRMPVTGISFHDARAYCHWLNIEKTTGHRLPTELEWEKCIRGCLGTTWAWGDREIGNLTHPQSPFGIQAPKGQLMEWTASVGADSRYRVVRGCTLSESSHSTDPSQREFIPEEQVSTEIGFRVVRELT